MVAGADIGHHGDLAAVETEPFAQHAAARGLEHGGVDVRVQQHVAGALRTAAVAGIDACPSTYTPSVVGHADAAPGGREQVRDQPHGRGLAVGAATATTESGRRRRRRTSAEMIASPTARPLPYGGFEVHPQPGAALTSTMPPPWSSSGFSKLWHTTSTPQIVEADHSARLLTARAATSGARHRSRRSPCRRCSGWRCCAARRACADGGTESASSPARRAARVRCRRSRILVSDVA